MGRWTRRQDEEVRYAVVNKDEFTEVAFGQFATYVNNNYGLTVDAARVKKFLRRYAVLLATAQGGQQFVLFKMPLRLVNKMPAAFKNQFVEKEELPAVPDNVEVTGLAVVLGSEQQTLEDPEAGP